MYDFYQIMCKHPYNPLKGIVKTWNDTALSPKGDNRSQISCLKKAILYSSKAQTVASENGTTVFYFRCRVTNKKVVRKFRSAGNYAPEKLTTSTIFCH